MHAIRERTEEVQEKVRERILTYMGAAFGLIAGLAWNDAIKTLIAQVFPVAQDTLIAKFVYAGLVTLLVVVISLWVAKAVKVRDSAEE
jgi:membrane protein YdbS with pleckstrin-like domain